MVKQYNESQYDDDLTVANDDYDDSSYSEPVDLFEFSASEEAPISRLKSLVLSIDWEITDEVLLQFNEELNDLKGIWAGEKINLVYVQALEKISKYIFQHKADSHPNAIKLLLTLYYNLEKIISSEDLSEAEKKVLLIEDVKRFEALKKHIAKQSVHSSQSPPVQEEPLKQEIKEEGVLFNLKAIVYAIDWEITDKDLDDLREEVVKLEKTFVNSKPKLILLQGIGTLGAYIKVKKSDANADAFKLLHLFYESLETIVDGNLNFEAEKAVLLPAVKGFNEFKTMLGATISPEKVNRTEEVNEEDFSASQRTVMPAFSGISEDESKGFQADEEAQNLGDEASTNVVSHIDDFFGDSVPRPGTGVESDISSGEVVGSSIALEGVNVAENGDEDDSLSELPVAANEGPEPVAAALSEVEDSLVMLEVDKNIALQGVDVETEADDDTDEDALPQGTDGVAPALVANEEEASAFSVNKLEDPAVAEDDVFSEISGTLEGFFGSDDATPAPVGVGENHADEPAVAGGQDADMFRVDKNIALQGVDVETEADDDSEEDELPIQVGGLAPALADNDEVSRYSETTVQDTLAVDSEIKKITGKLDGFFGEESASAPASEGTANSEIGQESLTSVGSVEDRDLNEGPAAEDEADIAKEFDDFFDDTGYQEDDKDAGVTELESIDDAIEVELSAEQDVVETVSEENEVVTFFETDRENNSEVVSEDQPASSVLKEMTQSFDITGTTTVPANEQIVEGKEVVFELAKEQEDASVVDDVRSGVHTPPQVKIKPTLLVPYTVVKGTGLDEKILSDRSFEVLTGCVDAFEVELEDRFFDEFNKEATFLSQSLAGKPVEKTFVQLLTTVVMHIDQFRVEADGGAIGLLQSISTSLNDMREGDVSGNQELLLAETVKVLNWQQGLITGIAANKLDTTDVNDVEGDVRGELVALRTTFKSEIMELRNEMRKLLSS